MSAPMAKPLAIFNKSPSAMENQYLSSASFSSTGSLSIPPWESTAGTYLHLPVCMRPMNLGVIICAKASASAPLSSTCRWHDTSQSWTCLFKCK